MNFACPKCARRYNIADDRVRGRTVNVRCKACQTVIPVTGPNPFEEESTRALSPGDIEALRKAERELSEAKSQARKSAPTRAPTPPPVEAGTWFIMVGGKQQGPLTEAQLEGAVKGRKLTARTYAWKEGMADWKRAGDVPELARRLPGPPSPVAPGGTPAPPAPQKTSTAARPAPSSAKAAPTSKTKPKPVEPAVAPSPEASDAKAPLGSLFDDVDVERDAPALPSGSGPRPARRKKAQQEAADPFAELSTSPDDEAPPPGEATQFFMAQAGVNRRNPPWKIAAFAVAAIGVPALLLYVLSVTNVVTLPFQKPAATRAEQVASDWAPSEGSDDALKRQMLGQREAEAEAARAAPAERPREDRTTAAASNKPRTAGAAKAAALYAMDDKRDVGPIARRSEAVVAANDSSGDGPPPENIARVVGDRQAAFQSCVEQELRRNPAFRGGKVGLTVTVGSSGAVRGASLDRRDLEGMPVGDCITRTARKMVFASFSGEPVQLVIPLVLTRGN